MKESIKTPIQQIKDKVVFLNKKIGQSEKKLAMVSSHILNKFDEARKRGDKIRKEMLDKIQETRDSNNKVN